MRIGELSRRTDVSVASIKYYLREGLLPPGELSSPNQAQYDDAHVRRLRLIRALVDVGGLTIAGARDVLAAVDDEQVSLYAALGRAQDAVMTRTEPVDDDATARAEKAVAEMVERRGWTTSETNPGWRTAVDVLAALDRHGGERVAGLLDVYAGAMETVAEHEVAAVVDTEQRERSIERVVTGIVLGGALIAALRGMAEQSAAAARYGGGAAPGGGAV
ncbi:MerR family transcriptional regulator [Actinomycetospora straminea]|uniref:MerR family transcriptional regulator n=1 Tax=Actinomycetospora straminea TaxID=663607 RepID=A0ABP9ENE9_9PSEU|nr:MerR family transcriptional regulator [Actinomycetospora straminea]MDD7935084.1 MerR family transcriptional regulator [Actinomycetospora straminea]